MKATNTIEVGVSAGLQPHHIEAFLERLRIARFSEVTLGKKRWVLSAFARWMKNQNVAMVDLDESAVASFMERLTSAPAARVQFESTVLGLFLAYLRGESVVHSPTAGDVSRMS
jgi:integrase/recombinase XerD